MKLGNTTAREKARIIAHELGHGVFSLEHPWAKFPKLLESTTDNLMDYGSGTHLYSWQWHQIHNPPPAIPNIFQDSKEGMDITTCTWDKFKQFWQKDSLIDQLRSYEKDFDKIFKNFAKLYTKHKKIEKPDQEVAKIGNWSVRGDAYYSLKHKKRLLDRMMEKIKKAEQGDNTSFNLKGGRIYMGRYKPKNRVYELAVYHVVDNAVTKKLSLDNYCTLYRNEQSRKEKTLQVRMVEIGDYIVMGLWHRGQLQMMIQWMSDTDQEIKDILAWFGILKSNPLPQQTTEPKVKIEAVLLDSIFGLKGDKAKAIAHAINKYSDEYEINTKERMSHFLGQIGVESAGLTSLTENGSYSARRIVEMFPWANRGHFYQIGVFNNQTRNYIYHNVNFNTSSCTGGTNNGAATRGNQLYYTLAAYNDKSHVLNAYGDTLSLVAGATYSKFQGRTDITKENIQTKVPSTNYNSGLLKIKPEYLNGTSSIFDVAYACKNGNGNIDSSEGSTYRGVGFIQLTGKNNYQTVYDIWKAADSTRTDSLSQFVELMKTDIDVAIEAAMIYWDDRNLNQHTPSGDKDVNSADFKDEVRKIGGKINLNDEEALETEIHSFSDRLRKTKLIYTKL